MGICGDPMRICLVYDCLFPYTVGGAERWYRRLGERLAADGHDVTYLTLRQWDRGEGAEVAGVDVRAVGPRMGLYAGPGQRRILPPLVFGFGVLWHLARHGRRYDVVHTCSFPYFSLLAIALLAPLARLPGRGGLVRGLEPELLARLPGRWGRRRRLGGAALVRPRPSACLLLLTALCPAPTRGGLRGEVTMLGGAYEGSLEPHPEYDNRPVVVFAGRHIPEKRVPAIVPAIARVRMERPEVRGLILGDGPERNEVMRLVRTSGLSGVIDVPGFVPTEVVDEAISHALCLVLPSRREGYGLVVVEAAAKGTPSVVVAGEDNAAVELIEQGVNGFVAASDSRRTWPGRSPQSRRGAPRCAVLPRRGSPPMRAACRSAAPRSWSWRRTTPAACADASRLGRRRAGHQLEIGSDEIEARNGAQHPVDVPDG